VYIVKDLTEMVSVDLIVTKSLSGRILSPMVVGSPSHELARNNTLARNGRDKNLKIFAVSNLYRGTEL
jgi:hypothetical protein